MLKVVKDRVKELAKKFDIIGESNLDNLNKLLDLLDNDDEKENKDDLTQEEVDKIYADEVTRKNKLKRDKRLNKLKEWSKSKRDMNGKIYLGDSITILRNYVEPDSVDCTITSPPYDNLRTYGGCDEWCFRTFTSMANELYRVTKPGGVVVWVVGDATNKGSETGSSFKQALYFKDIGFLLHDTMIFQKNTSSFPARADSKRYSQIFEYMFVFVKGGKVDKEYLNKKKETKTKKVDINGPNVGNLICDKENRWKGYVNFGQNSHRNKSGELKKSKTMKPVPDFSPRNNIWKYEVNKNYNSTDKESHNHPAIFPEALVMDHIETWTNEGDVVLDLFLGSGTTIKMAHLMKRKYIGIEINKEYINKTVIPRLNKYINNLVVNKIENNNLVIHYNGVNEVPNEPNDDVIIRDASPEEE